MKTVDEAIRERLAKIAAIQEEVAALKRVKPILEDGGPEPVATAAGRRADRRFKTRPDSDASLAAKAIRDAKKPLPIADIMDYLGRKGKKHSKGSIVSTLAKMAKHGKVFYRCRQPNTFGLLEWPEKPDMREG